MKKAQASLEQLLVIAMALTVVAVTFYLATAYSADSLKISQAEDAVGRLSGSADYVYALGPNTKEYVEVYLPQDITQVNISGRRIVLTIQTSGGTTDVFANAKADLVGGLPSARGRQKVLVQYLETGKVLIGQAGLACDPQFLSKAFNSSGSESEDIVVSNNADSEVTGLTSVLSGSVAAIASIGSLPETIPKGESANLQIDFSIPPEQAPGTYTGTVVVDSENDGSCVVNLNVHVNRETSCTGLCLARGYDSGTCRATPTMCVANGEDYVSANDYTCGVGAPNCCCGPTQDVLGPVVSLINASPENASTIDNVTVTALCNDTATGASFIQSARVKIDDGAWTDMDAVDGTFSHSVLEQVDRNVGKHTNGQHVAWVDCTDAAGNRGPTAYLYFNVTMADVIGPIITFMNHTEYPTTLTNISMSGSATDYYTGNRNIKKCVVKVDDGAWIDAEPADGAYDSPTEDYYYNIGEMAVGYHDVYAQCVDVLNNSGGIYNQSFGVVSVDLMLVLDRSGSMAWNVTNVTSNAVVSTTNTGFTQVKSLTIGAKNGDLANISVEISASASGCTVLFEVRVSGDVIAAGNRTSTSYGYVHLNNVNISEYPTPFQLALYMKRSSSGSCTVY
ncbi:MAG: hypothetical protein WC488_01755, partial [Candidatus Micrarchaeia archaeon]